MAKIKFRNGNSVGTYCPWRIGDLLFSITATNPNVEWPGTTWSLYAQDRVLVGAGTTYTLLQYGGSATHTHTLNGTGYAGVCTHAGRVYWSYKTGVSWKSTYFSGNTSDPSGSANDNEIEGSNLYGSTGSTSNMQPFIAVNIWRRTA